MALSDIELSADASVWRKREAWLSRLSSAAREEADRPIERQIALQRYLQQLGYLPD